MSNDTMVFSDYGDDSIKVLEFPENVRKRPGMYIGGTGQPALHHMVWELLDNSVDEALAGCCTQIDVTINSDMAATIRDNGRGIPLGIQAQTGRPIVETVFTVLHSGSKFDGNGVSGGLHGVGASVVNALSSRLAVTVQRDNQTYRQSFSRGMAQEPLLTQTEAVESTGTTVMFCADEEIFHELDESGKSIPVSLDSHVISTRLQEIAYLNSGLGITFEDLRDGSSKSYNSQGGIASYVEHLNKERKPVHPLPVYFHVAKNAEAKQVRSGLSNASLEMSAECAFQWTEDQGDLVRSFVNNVPTARGGVHVTALYSALAQALCKFIADNKAPNSKPGEAFTSEDFRDGLTAIIAVRLNQPEFEGQTKERLGNAGVTSVITGLILPMLLDWLQRNPESARAIIQRVQLARDARVQARKAINLVRKASALDRSMSLPGKLADCSEGDPRKRELFIVEGDSAGGSAKQGRDRTFQAILPLRGKILNVERAETDRVYDSAELQALIQAIGLGVNLEGNSTKKPKGPLLRNATSLDLERLRYHKVIIMTDADVDGGHIRSLILTFLFRYARPLIEQGFVFIAQPPLYKVEKSKKVHYCYSDEMLKSLLADARAHGPIQRFKGLGEMMPEQLWETTMNPETRTLKQVTMDNVASAEQVFNLLMGGDVMPRREFIEANALMAGSLDV